MNNYRFRIDIKEGEYTALKDAISVYKDFIKDKIGDEIKAPYWARLQSVNRIEDRLRDSINRIFENEQ